MDREPTREKLADLGSGLAVYKIHLDLLRERDVNARVMSKEKFDRLKQNIASDQRLESLPYVVRRMNPAGNEEFMIISGHHRTRAARAAKVLEIPCLVDESELTMDQIISKQLAHNAINGHDDPQVLSRLYKEISDVTARIASGITDQELKVDAPIVYVDDVSFSLDYEHISILFLPPQFKRFKEVIQKLEAGTTVLTAERENFEAFKKAAQEVGKNFDIRTAGGVLSKMVEIVAGYIAEHEKANAEEAAQHEAEEAEHERVRKKVSDAIRTGALPRPSTCSRCGAECTPQAHHTDYSKPLEVTWLCSKCHDDLHVEIRKAQKAEPPAA